MYSYVPVPNSPVERFGLRAHGFRAWGWKANGCGLSIIAKDQP